MSQYLTAHQLSHLEQQVAELLSEARRQGASSAEAGVAINKAHTTTVRLGEVDTIKYHQSRSLAITVYFGQCKGSASTRDFNSDAIKATVRAACDSARYTSADPAAGLADAERMAQQFPDLDLYHPWDVSPEQAIALATECEQAALQYHPQIKNSQGATFTTSDSSHVYGNSHGFVGSWSNTYHALRCLAIAQQAEEKQRGYWFTLASAPDGLENAQFVGEQAAQRAVETLGARAIDTRSAPVLFNPQTASSLLSHLINAIQGGRLYRKSSFLLDKVGQRIFPDTVHIHEQPHLARALGSAPFDAEGVATQAQDFVQAGCLQGYVLDSYTARKLGLQTTGNAGGVHNLSIDPVGHYDFEQLLQQMDTGLLVTHLMGSSVNLVTGDYSRGAEGFWVEGGKIQFPVQEITIAGHLQDMFQNLQAVGTDIDTRGNIRTGSWLIDNMTIAGKAA